MLPEAITEATTIRFKLKFVGDCFRHGFWVHGVLDRDGPFFPGYLAVLSSTWFPVAVLAVNAGRSGRCAPMYVELGFGPLSVAKTYVEIHSCILFAIVTTSTRYPISSVAQQSREPQLKFAFRTTLEPLSVNSLQRVKVTSCSNFNPTC